MIAMKVALTLLGQPAGEVRLVAATQADWSDAIFSEPVTLDAYGVASGSIRGLQYATSYRISYAVNRAIVTGSQLGAKTPPAPGSPENFKLAFASCVGTSESAASFYNVLQKVYAGDIQILAHLGDLGYQNVGNIDPGELTVARFNEAFAFNLRAAHQCLLYGRVQFLYINDDHDGPGGGNTWSGSPGWDVFWQFFRGRLGFTYATPSGPGYYTVTRGRVRVIVTDSRSQRSDPAAADNADKVVWLPDQYAWIKSQILAAKAAGQAVFLVISWPTVSVVTTSDIDVWGEYSVFRADFAAWIAANGVADRIFILEGDQHSLALQLTLTAENPLGVPTMVSAPWFKNPIVKGGPYDYGPFPAASADPWVSQYSTVEVTDNGGPTVSIRAMGFQCDLVTWAETAVIDQTFTLQAA